MADNVLPFPPADNREAPKRQLRRIRVPAADEVVRKVRRMLRFNRMMMPNPEMQQWLSARSITMMQVLSTIKQGQAMAAFPTLDDDGDLVITIKRVAAGRRTHVTVAVNTAYFVIRNVY